MDLGLYDIALEGGGAATKWQRQHAARQRAKLKKQHRAEAKAAKARALKEAKADLKARKAKWWKGWHKRAAAAKAAGKPIPGKQGAPWQLGINNPCVVDMTGRVFGRLTVIRSAPVSLTNRTAQRCRCWVVKCSCGSRERIINGTTLRQGNSRSCGCLVREVQRNAWKPGGCHWKRAKARREATEKLKRKPLSYRLRLVRRKMIRRQKLTTADALCIVQARRIVKLWEIEKGIVKPRKRYK
jgi:hypothetical protein